MQRMLDRGGVHDAKVDGIALRERELLVVRPLLAVERERRLERLCLLDGIEPLGDHPDALIGRRRSTRRVDDEPTGELRVEPVAVVEVRQPLERRPIEEVAGLVELERDVARRAGRELHRVAIRRHRAAQSAECEGGIGAVVDGEMHGRADGRAQQRCRNRRRLSRLGERQNAHDRIELALGLIGRFDDVERQRERAARERSGRVPIVVHSRDRRVRDRTWKRNAWRRRNDRFLRRRKDSGKQERGNHGESHRRLRVRGGCGLPKAGGSRRHVNDCGESAPGYGNAKVTSPGSVVIATYCLPPALNVTGVDRTHCAPPDVFERQSPSPVVASTALR